MAIVLVRYCYPVAPPVSFVIKEEKIEVSGSKLKDLIEVLVARHGKRFENFVLDPITQDFREYIMMFINGVHVKNLGCLQAKIKDKDYILLLPPIAGG